MTICGELKLHRYLHKIVRKQVKQTDKTTVSIKLRVRQFLIVTKLAHYGFLLVPIFLILQRKTDIVKAKSSTSLGTAHLFPTNTRTYDEKFRKGFLF